MRKTIFIAATMLSVCHFIYGQKTTIGVLPVQNKSGSGYQETSAITDALTTAFTKAKRFMLVDRTQMDALKQEKNLQKTEDFIDGSTIEQGKSLGAEFLISSSLNSYENDGSVCKFVLNLKVIDVSTGQIVSSDVIEVKGGGRAGQIGGALGGAALGTGNLAGSGNREKALRKALSDIEDEIDGFVAKNFPLTVSIAEISEEKGGEAEVVLIAVGSNYGIEKKDVFKVVTISQIEVDGKKLTRKKEIGELRVTSVEDENFSKCEVRSGGKDILAKFNAGENIKCISIK